MERDVEHLGSHCGLILWDYRKRGEMVRLGYLWAMTWLIVLGDLPAFLAYQLEHPPTATDSGAIVGCSRTGIFISITTVNLLTPL